MNALLENRRNNADPKCCNCGWWRGHAAPAGKCERHDATTLDLAVCTDWRDGDPIQTLIEPEHDE